MTKREREQVVELLRCAADLAQRNEGCVLAASDRLYATTDSKLVDIGLDAWSDAYPEDDWFQRDLYALLEAAARVEEGSWS